MTSTILYEKPYSKIDYIETSYLLRITWNGFVNFISFKDTLEYLLLVAGKYPQVRLFLSDQRKRKVLTREESEWFATNFAPRFIKTRTALTKLAIIKSEDIFGAVSGTTTMNKVVNSHTIIGFTIYAYFDTEKEAIDWLLLS